MTQLISAFLPTSHDPMKCEWQVGIAPTPTCYICHYSRGVSIPSHDPLLVTTRAPGKIPLAWIASVLILLSMRILIF